MTQYLVASLVFYLTATNRRSQKIITEGTCYIHADSDSKMLVNNVKAMKDTKQIFIQITCKAKQAKFSLE